MPDSLRAVRHCIFTEGAVEGNGIASFSGLALSVTFGARFPLLSLRDIFPRSGGSLSSKGEPLA